MPDAPETGDLKVKTDAASNPDFIRISNMEDQ
jgi:hypothetical protein